jgi:predicted ATP-grasp superfamily ATP-dependent carboligase
MRVLLSDGSGMTSRQAATHLAHAGHDVEILSADCLSLNRFTRHVRRIHRVPPYASDPFAWLEAALSILRCQQFDALLPTHEQVAVLSREVKRVVATGVRVAVPAFSSLRRLQDKVAAYATLDELDLPQPETRVLHSRGALSRSRTPIYIKTAIGTASAGVYYAKDRLSLERVTHQLTERQLADGVLAQEPLRGRLVMAQAVFCQGELVGWHANLRLREGVRGGAAAKRGIRLPDARAHLTRLGKALAWHGALSADVILTAKGPRYIDVNPRLVEPGNAWHAGVDLTGALLTVTVGEDPKAQRVPASGTVTRQLLVALLGAAQRANSRRAVFSEALAAIRQRGVYRASVEELTPIRGDWRAGVPIAAVGLALTARPSTWQFFVANAAERSALTPQAWESIRRGSVTPATGETRTIPA